MTSNDGSTFFSLVSTRTDRQRVFKYIVENKIRLQCKISDADSIYITPERMRDGFLLGESTSTIHFLTEVTAIMSFMLTHERYFMKTVLMQKDENSPRVVLDLSKELYKLQRRDLYRIPIPSQYNAKAFIGLMGAQKIQQTFPILNLSGGGFALEFSLGQECPFEKGREVEGLLQVGGRLKKDFVAEVTYIRTIGTRGSGLLRVGFQFSSFDHGDKEEIVQTVMDMHRDLYSMLRLAK